MNITLAMKDELDEEISFEYMGWDALPLMEQLHAVLFNELVNRDVSQINRGWTTRTNNVFKINGLKTVGNVMFINENSIKNLKNCGKMVRFEIYTYFKNDLGIELKQWDF